MNGNSCDILRSITLGYTTKPSEIFWSVDNMMSAVKKASGSVMRRFALSSRVRSNHCTLVVINAFWWSTIR
jgi:hypothetical protein